MDAIGYVRVNANAEAGLARQRATISAAATRNGWNLIDVIEDAGFSANDQQRPGLVRALAAMERGDAGILLVNSLDRLSRSVAGFEAIVDTADRQGWKYVALDLPMDEAMMAMARRATNISKLSA